FRSNWMPPPGLICSGSSPVPWRRRHRATGCGRSWPSPPAWLRWCWCPGWPCVNRPSLPLIWPCTTTAPIWRKTRTCSPPGTCSTLSARCRMRNGLLLTLVLPVALAYGDTPAPPAAFWDYLAEFSDDNGQVFDPLDLTDAEQLVRQQARAA